MRTELSVNVGVTFEVQQTSTPLGERWAIRSRSAAGNVKVVSHCRGESEAREAVELLNVAAQAVMDASDVLVLDRAATA